MGNKHQRKTTGGSNWWSCSWNICFICFFVIRETGFSAAVITAFPNASGNSNKKKHLVKHLAPGFWWIHHLRIKSCLVTTMQLTFALCRNYRDRSGEKHFRNQPTCRWFKTLSHPCYIMLTKRSFHPIDGEEKSQLKQLRYLKLFSWMLRLHQQYEFQTWIKVIWRTNICSKKLPCGVFGQMRSLAYNMPEHWIILDSVVETHYPCCLDGPTSLSWIISNQWYRTQKNGVPPVDLICRNNLYVLFWKRFSIILRCFAGFLPSTKMTINQVSS